MKKIFIATIILIITQQLTAQNVGIGTTSPANSALLELNASNKGFLMPRVNLTGVSDLTTVPSPTNALLVYNLATASSGADAVIPGYYYFSSGKWIPLANANNTWSLSGNAPLVGSTNFIGTTTNVPLKFKVNNIPAGGLYPIGGNTILGSNAMTGTGDFSYGVVAIGSGALRFNNLSNLVAIGDSAMFNVGTAFVTGESPIENVAVGSKSMYSNLLGHGNTAVGFRSLYTNTIGHYNVAIGNGALFNNADGDANTSLGFAALGYNAAGSWNTAVGYQAGINITANWNTGMGYRALFLTTGSGGAANVAVGYQALYNNTSGSNNTAIGCNAGPANGNGAFVNSTAIGQASVYTASNQVRFGSTVVNNIGGYSEWKNISDVRFKKNIKPAEHGLDFILKLEPIVYNLDLDKLNRFVYGEAVDTLFKPADLQTIHDNEKIVMSGFSAQQVEAVAKSIGYDFNGVQKPQNDKDHYSIAYASFVVPLVKAVQEQQQIIDHQKEMIAKLEARMAKLEAK